MSLSMCIQFDRQCIFTTTMLLCSEDGFQCGNTFPLYIYLMPSEGTSLEVLQFVNSIQFIQKGVEKEFQMEFLKKEKFQEHPGEVL